MAIGGDASITLFKGLAISAHTNLIEETWMYVKKSLNKNGTQKTLLDIYFVEFMWKHCILIGF
jgi:hypothetical protein